MAWDNDWKWGYLKGGWPEPGKPLATRRNVDKAKATERVMLEQVEGQDGIRKRVSDDVTLRTRGGFPVFEAETMAVETTGYRWFSALAGTKLGLIDPYELTVKQESLKPTDFTYMVAPLSSSAGLRSEFGWHDVWLFDNATGSIYINYRKHERLAEVIPRPPGDADAAGRVPVLLLDAFPPVGATASSAYEGLNAADAVKPVFAVGRVSVAVMQKESAVTPALLGNATARNEGRALLVEPRIDGHLARLGQLMYTGSAWDHADSGWIKWLADVTLSTVAIDAFEYSASVDLPTLTMANQGSAAGLTVLNQTLNVALGVVGIGERSQIASMANAMVGATVFPWRSEWRRDIALDRSRTYTRTTYAGSYSDGGAIFGLRYSISASNTLYVDSGTESVAIPAQQVHTGAAAQPLSGFAIWHSNGPTFHYETPSQHLSGHMDGVDLGAPRGADYSYSNGSSLGSASYTATTQVAEAEIAVDDKTILRCDFARTTEGGSYRQVQAKTGLYNTYLGNPYGYINSVTGARVVGTFFSDGNYSADYTAYPDLYAQHINSTLDTIVGTALYYLGGDYAADDTITNSCQASTIARPPVDDRSLAWETRDYVLYDTGEEYFIYVRSQFAGEKHYNQPVTGTLDVDIVVETPLGVTEIGLFADALPMSDLLAYNADYKIGGTVSYVPTHALRFFFAPPFWTQGMFPGLAHTTGAERASGVEHVELIDFTLELTYDDLDGGSKKPTSRFAFAPRNLIEMLYAFIYSSDQYGHGDERYPVINTAAYDILGKKLFKAWRIQLRDGVETNWPAPLGAPYGTTEAKRLGRT